MKKMVLFCTLLPGILEASDKGGSIEGTIFQMGSAGAYIIASLLFGKALVWKRGRRTASPSA